MRSRAIVKRTCDRFVLTVRFFVLFAVVFVLAGCSDSPRPFGRVGEEAPAYAARTIAGDSLRLSELRGRAVLLNVWATWCIPCRKELPELQALHTRYAAQGLEVVGVSVDEGNDDAAVRNFANEFGITYTIVRDPATLIYSAFAIPGVPATFLIDRNGKVAWRVLGPFSAADTTLQAALRTVL